MEREFESVFSRAVPRRRGPAAADRPRQHAHHRHRGRGAPAGQEGQAAVAAVRRRAVADRGGAAGRDLPGPARRRSTSWTRSRPPSTTSTCGRLIELLEELRETSQLIVITHQKRTMEIADALYGVTMRDDGVTDADQPAHARPGIGRRRQLVAISACRDLAQRDVLFEDIADSCMSRTSLTPDVGLRARWFMAQKVTAMDIRMRRRRWPARSTTWRSSAAANRSI